MKQKFALLLALTLCLTGCGAREAAETTEAPAVTPTVITEAAAETTLPPTEAPAPVYPETIQSDIRMEGEPTVLTLDLFDGGSYVVYLTRDEWTLETGMVDGYLTDHWVCSFNDMISFDVISFGALSPEEAEKYVRDTHSTYVFDDSRPDGIGGSDFSNHYFLNGEIHSDGENTFAVLTQFPMEAGDGFGGRTSRMMGSFEIK